ISRIVNQKITALRDQIQGVDQFYPESIHDFHTTIKFLRAILRLIKKVIRQAEFQSKDQQLRDAGRQLSPLRDSFVIPKTIKKLQAALPDDKKESFNEILGRIVKRIKPPPSAKACKKLLDRELATLNQISAFFESLSVNDINAPVHKALRKSFMRCRRTMR